MKKLFLFMSVALLLIAAPVKAVRASETVEGAKKDIVAFKADMSQKLESAGKNLQDLKAKAGEKSSQIHEQTVKELEAAHDRAQKELDRIKADSKENWAKMKADLADSIDELNDKIQKELKK